MNFPTLDTIPENTSKFASKEFTVNNSDTMNVSVQCDKTTGPMQNPETSTYQVLGSNVSGNVADMVPVVDERGNDGERSCSQPFVKAFFPYKYIAIQYNANGNVGTGTLSVLLEQKVQRANLV